MARRQNRLNLAQAEIDKLPGPDKPGGTANYTDTVQRNLSLRVGARARTWTLYGKINGRVVRKKLGEWPDLSTTAARNKAESLRSELRDEPEQRAEIPITIVEAFDQTLEASKRGERSRRDWAVAVGNFMAWLDKKYPRLENWDALSVDHIDRYDATLKHLSPNARRMAMQPLRQTSKRMARRTGRDIAGGLRLSNETIDTPSEVYLTDTRDLIQALMDRGDHTLAVGAALQAWAALRVSEAVRLRWSRVDLSEGTITITGKVKNRYSERVIPIARQLVEILRGHRERADAKAAKDTVREADPHVLRGPRGHAYEGPNRDNYAKALSAAIRRVLPVEYSAKDLRNCVPYWAVDQGLDGVLLEQFVGHSPRGVSAKHYLPKITQAKTRGQRAKRAEVLARFRARLIEPLEAAIDAAAEGGEQTEAEVVAVER